VNLSHNALVNVGTLLPLLEAARGIFSLWLMPPVQTLSALSYAVSEHRAWEHFPAGLSVKSGEVLETRMQRSGKLLPTRSN
jgi:hypothetical protein